MKDNINIFNKLNESFEHSFKSKQPKGKLTEGLYDNAYKINDKDELKELALNAAYVANNDEEIIKELLDRMTDEEKEEYKEEIEKKIGRAHV